MNILNFMQLFPDKASYIAYLKEQREQSGVVCKRCGYKEHFWNTATFECKQCQKAADRRFYRLKIEYLQYYLHEFCYKFNRRYFSEKLFDRLVVVAITYNTDFKSRI